MQTKRRISLNGVELDEVDENIIITGIDEAAGKDNINAIATAYGNGQRIIRKRRDTLDVTVKFAIKIKNNRMNARERTLERVNAWAANGGWLRMANKTGRRLRVVLAQAPGPGDMFNWSNEFTMVFRAYEQPYWESNSTTNVTTEGTKLDKKRTGSFKIEVPGNTDTQMDITVKNQSGQKISYIHLNVGGKQINFDGLTMSATSSLNIRHWQDGGRYYFSAKIGGTSLLPYRTGDDDFTVSPGEQTITFDCQRAVTVTASVRGHFL